MTSNMSINAYHAILYQAFLSDVVEQFDANYGESVLSGQQTKHFYSYCKGWQ